MTGLLLVFIAVFALNELALQFGYDRWARREAQRPDRVLVTGLVVLGILALTRAQPAWHVSPGASAYLLMFALAAVAVAHSRACALRPSKAVLPKALLVGRRWLPLLMANAAVVAYALMERPNPPALVALCCSATLVMVVLDALLPPLLERLRVADVPVALQGAPIACLTAGVLALASMGFIGALPW